MNSKRATPILPWPGGKRRLAQHIIPRIPAHTCYVEMFGGAGAVLVAKPPSKIEVWNDFNSDLVNLFRQAKHHPDALCHELEFMPSSRAEFGRWAAIDLSAGDLTELQRAAIFLRVAMLSFGGQGSHFGTGKLAGGTAYTRVSRRMDTVRAFAARMDGVCIEHLDWEALLDRYDSPTTCFYCDPPYYGAPCGRYPGWDADQITRLAARLSGCKGSWIVSLNDHPVCRSAFSGHTILPLIRANGIGNRGAKKTGRTYREILVIRRV